MFDSIIFPGPGTMQGTIEQQKDLGLPSEQYGGESDSNTTVDASTPLTRIDDPAEDTTSETKLEAHDPSEPIARPLSLSWASLSMDVAFILASVPFLVLACLLARADGVIVVERSRQAFEDSIRVTATALPIVFAAVFSRMTTQIARWTLERGSNLSVIEQWLGSRTVFSAFATQFRLGGFNTIGALMGFTWALSPLGTQSVLRVFGTRPVNFVTNTSVTYFDNSGPSAFVGMYIMENLASSNPHITDQPKLMSQIYAAALVSADGIKSSSQDSWGNLKIPYMNLSSYPPNPASGGPDAPWMELANASEIIYSSLVGLPALSGSYPASASKDMLSFTLESSYLELDCSPFSSSAEETYTTAAGIESTGDELDLNYANYFSNKGFILSWNHTLAGVDNGTWQASIPDVPYQSANTWVLALDTFLDPLWFVRHKELSLSGFANETGISSTQAKLQLLAWTTSYGWLVAPRATTCWASQIYVESKVICNASSQTGGQRVCGVTAQRPSQKPHASSNITNLSFPTVFSEISARLPQASGAGYTESILDPSITYLMNTSSSVMLGGPAVGNSGVDTGNLPDIPVQDINHRLGQLINTYIIISQASQSIAGGLADNEIRNITTAAESIHPEDVYNIKKTWLLFFFITTLVMLIGSIVAAVFCHVSTTPEILGFASSVVRHSKYVDLAAGSGALGGLEMTRVLAGIEFRYGVVETLPESGQQVLGVSRKHKVAAVKKGVAYL